jgi:hypothetical protein
VVGGGIGKGRTYGALSRELARICYVV